MRIELFKTSPDRSGRYTVRFEDGTVLRLYRQTLEDFGIYTGKDFTEEEFRRLQTSAAEISAKMRAVRIVSAANVSKKDLENRLIQKGETPKDAKMAVAWLSDMKVLDDGSPAETIVRGCIAKGSGLQRARQVLYEKRIPKELWDEALEDYPDQEEAIAVFLRSRLSGKQDDPKAQKRAIDALLRRGHSYGTIRRAMQNLSFDTDEFPEEDY